MKRVPKPLQLPSSAWSDDANQKVRAIGNKEQRLAKRLQDGEKTAAREFYALYANRLAGVCSRYITDEEDLKDVFQDAFVHIISHIQDFQYRGAGSLQVWATKVVVSRSLKFLQTKNRLKLVPLDLDRVDVAEDDEPPISDIPPDIVHQLVSRLPTGYRTVLNLYVFEGHSHQGIARLLGITVNASTSQLHRAKRLLSRMIQQYNDNKELRQ